MKTPLIAIPFIVLACTLVYVFSTGFTVGKPFQGPGFDPAKGVTLFDQDGMASVSITYVRLSDDRKGRRGFNRNLWKLLENMPETPGLIGYSVRRKLFGSDAWTLSVWSDEASMSAFASSPAHRQAIAESATAIGSLRFARVEIPHGDLPLTWPQALEYLEEESLEEQNAR